MWPWPCKAYKGRGAGVTAAACIFPTRPGGRIVMRHQAAMRSGVTSAAASPAKRRGLSHAFTPAPLSKSHECSKPACGERKDKGPSSSRMTGLACRLALYSAERPRTPFEPLRSRWGPACNAEGQASILRRRANAARWRRFNDSAIRPAGVDLDQRSARVIRRCAAAASGTGACGRRDAPSAR